MDSKSLNQQSTQCSKYMYNSLKGQNMHLIMFKYVHTLEYNMKWQAQLMQIEKKELNGKMSKSNWNLYWIYNIKKQQPQQASTQNSSTIISKTALKIIIQID